MKQLVFYLAHPIGTRQTIREWELEFEGIYPTLTILNPFYDAMPGVDRSLIHQMDKGEATRFDITEPYELVDMDLRMVSYCDGIIAYINGDPSYGTLFEVAEAKRLGLIVYIICTNGMHEHPWLQVYATRVFSGFAEFEKYVSAIYL
jgi:nucleoside 2-deoxyribosyltransferase